MTDSTALENHLRMSALITRASTKVKAILDSDEATTNPELLATAMKLDTVLDKAEDVLNKEGGTLAKSLSEEEETNLDELETKIQRLERISAIGQDVAEGIQIIADVINPFSKILH